MLLKTVVSHRSDLGAGVCKLVLRAVDGPLPAFQAGAHIDLHLANGLVRSYSLMNAETDVDRYEIAVGLDAHSRGGSRHVHAQVVVGSVLTVSAPRNQFALDEQAGRSVLIGGGVGMTPLLSMARRLQALGKDWHLVYCCRTRSQAPFLSELGPLQARLHLHADDEQPQWLDMAALMRAQPGAHFYCCGPAGMIDAYKAAAQAVGLPAAQVHCEYFAAPAPVLQAGQFQVHLQRRGLSFDVMPGRTILQTLQAAGIDASHSCESGICGECRVAVLEGVPDHQDFVLSDQERAANDAMLICCSGSKTPRLVLDL